LVHGSGCKAKGVLALSAQNVTGHFRIGGADKDSGDDHEFVKYFKVSLFGDFLLSP
jgi:hypothetical protein